MFSVIICISTNVRRAGQPNAIVDYFDVVGELDMAVVIAADVVLLTRSDKLRIGHSQQIVFTYRTRTSLQLTEADCCSGKMLYYCEHVVKVHGQRRL